MKDKIIIKGARLHNLKNLNLEIPKFKLNVITGLSGSGKSSLAFDTLYAEGQRRYVESLSAYARQFLGRMSKPEVDDIKGLTPAIAIQQKANNRNPHSTVGTSTEIYEYLKLLFSRIGVTYSPISGVEVKRHSVSDVVSFILSLPKGSTVMLLSPILLSGKLFSEKMSVLLQQGFLRVLIKNKIYRIEEIINNKFSESDEIELVIDKFAYSVEDDLKTRIYDSVQTAFYEGNFQCKCIISLPNSSSSKVYLFSNRFEADGIIFAKPSPNMFSFNNPYGACSKCQGFGSVIGIDKDLVIPNKSLSIYHDAIACWRGEKLKEWKNELVLSAYKFDFPIHKAWNQLTEEQQELVWVGNEHFNGINTFFKFIEDQIYKIQYRVLLSRYRGKTICNECKGSRLRKDANYVKIYDKSISDITSMSIDDALSFFNNLQLNKNELDIASRLLLEIKNRLSVLANVGLGYLTLNRLSSTLSGGESQRINLATSIGSCLVGSMYVLDEPSIGLHPRDTHKLLNVIMQLRDIGNTIIVVEHDEDFMKIADNIIDIGPLAGEHGGHIIFNGAYKDIINNDNSLTGKYLSGKNKITYPKLRRKWSNFIEITGIKENNLKNISVKIPLGVFVAVTGVSGSGKTSLIKGALAPGLRKKIGLYDDNKGNFDNILGDYKTIENIELVDQNPIGRSSRSNPATYIKAWDDIRTLFTNTNLAIKRRYKPGVFSFNIPGGRCDSCEGEGYIEVSMQFMADIKLLCDECKGKRFKSEILEITYEGLNISDILDLTVEDAITLFAKKINDNSIEKKIINKLKPLVETGLGYLKLGQSSSTLSGGEAQRVKLASFLNLQDNEKKTVFIFDEPTSGLHFHDISKLLSSFNALIENGHSIIVIEHNLEIIKCADWIIDLGPEGGSKGGYIVCEGTPEQIIKNEISYTAKYLKEKLK